MLLVFDLFESHLGKFTFIPSFIEHMILLTLIFLFFRLNGAPLFVHGRYISLANSIGDYRTRIHWTVLSIIKFLYSNIAV